MSNINDKTTALEVRCHYCGDAWLEEGQIGQHFSSVHQQPNVTWDSLKVRLISLGAWDVREKEQAQSETTTQPKKNWLFSDDAVNIDWDTNNNNKRG